MGIFFYGLFKFGLFFNQTFTGGYFTDNSKVGIFLHGPVTRDIFFLHLKRGYFSISVHFDLLLEPSATELGNLPTYHQHISMLSFLRRIISSKLLLIRSNSNINPQWGDNFLLDQVIRERIQLFRKPIDIKARMRRRRWSSVRLLWMFWSDLVWSISYIFHWLLAIASFQKYVF